VVALASNPALLLWRRHVHPINQAELLRAENLKKVNRSGKGQLVIFEN
jgi:hypothetical protein